ncbi:mechanosensitive ion channel family protein [Luteimonas aestuarii]|nr:mechanosensitive ion channel domain-containing protein [Luteimonas aestuarii]
MAWMDWLQAQLSPYPWAWTAAVAALLLLAAWLANWLTKHVLLRGIRRLLRKTVYRDAEHDSDVRMSVIPRLANVVPALVIYAGAVLIPDLPPLFVSVVRGLCQAWIVLTVALSVARALDVVNREYERRPRAIDKPIKGYLQVAKIVVFVLAGISVFATLIGAEFVHVLTGLGAMTAVTMLIFQDTILSFVASVQIGSDGRVRMGDWIEMPSQNADGDVIDIALHTVTVRNWDLTITTIPTKKLISESFKNWRGMSESGGRRIKRALHIDQSSVRFLEKDERDALRRVALIDEYLDAKRAELESWNAKLEAAGKDPVNARRVTNLGTFRAYALAYLRAHPKVRKDMTLLVRQMDPSATGIPLEIYCFTATTAWAEYEGIQSDIFDHLLAILPEFGLRVFQSTSDAAFAAALSGRDATAPAEAAADA